MNRKVLMVPIVCLLALLAFFFFGTAAYAATAGAEQPPGEPPYGLATQGDAGGTKLYGCIFIEYSNFIGTSYADARIFVRLRMNNQIQTFYAETNMIPISSISANQEQIIDVISPQILAAFFPGETGLTITLKNVSEFLQHDALDNISPEGQAEYLNDTYLPWLAAYLKIKPEKIPPFTLPPRFCTMVIADIEVAVK